MIEEASHHNHGMRCTKNMHTAASNTKPAAYKTPLPMGQSRTVVGRENIVHRMQTMHVYNALKPEQKTVQVKDSSTEPSYQQKPLPWPPENECNRMNGTVVNAILWMCSSTMCICSYALDILSFERYVALAISLRMISWSGNGVTSLTMVSFWSHRSKTVCSLPFFFGMQSIGTAWCATVGIHHRAVVYLSIVWESSSQKCSGHFGSR